MKSSKAVWIVLAGTGLAFAGALFLWCVFGLNGGLALGVSTVGLGLLGACTGSGDR